MLLLVHHIVSFWAAGRVLQSQSFLPTDDEGFRWCWADLPPDLFLPSLGWLGSYEG